MASDGATGSIADRVAQSLAAFEAIDTVETEVEPDDSQFIWVQTISDQLSKFKLWAGNIGAHRTGRSSLDYRLRDSSHLHTQVLRLLDDLITSLDEAHSILSGETLPWDQDPGEAGELEEELKDLLKDEDFEFDSELSQLTKGIADAIGNLLRLSISLRNPAPHDRFMSTEYAKVRYFEANDKAHVGAKFPKLSQTIIMRLGQALSQKRQYFRYRESHHDKLARGLFDSGRSEAGAQSTVASSIPLAMRNPGSVPVFGELDEDERSDTGFSQTSFATTAPDSGRLRIPPLPKKSHDGPFECPFCFMLISVSSTHQWKKHVLSDLRPYICLAEDCSAANKEYGRRHEWMNHMLQKHWKSWACPYQCGLNHTTEKNLRQHVTGTHGSVTEMELDAMIARCGRIRSLSPSSPAECPFCQDTMESVRQYQRHVGRHQVDLALFALPRIEDGDEEPGVQNEDQETTPTHSGSYSEALSDGISPTALAEPTETINGIHEEEDEAQWSETASVERPASEDENIVHRSGDIEIEVKRQYSGETGTPAFLLEDLRGTEAEPGWIRGHAAAPRIVRMKLPTLLEPVNTDNHTHQKMDSAQISSPMERINQDDLTPPLYRYVYGPSTATSDKPDSSSRSGRRETDGYMEYFLPADVKRSTSRSGSHEEGIDIKKMPRVKNNSPASPTRHDSHTTATVSPSSRKHEAGSSSSSSDREEGN
ncbi:hypothetical protein E0Z10_g9300 [Xylaria hypoxylon]|uniref:C2H2-type domain-containing protein n=1 Tax=Xylaria hypoxylon TaxID=37992 RepID=A0A4Z0YLB6_9PEZI|nr:hypothetical protein E0Z10_g9300 [Xylaria hypoxylon]